MSKKPKYLKGKFYSIYTTGGSHPSLLYKKNRRKNKYHLVVFDSSQGRHRTPLFHPTSANIKKSYVQNRPLLAIKQDLGNHELDGISIHKDDKPKIKTVERRSPRMTRRYKQIHKK